MRCIKKSTFSLECESPELFVTSQWQKTAKPSVAFLIYRWIFAAYFGFVLILSIYTAAECEQASFYMIYLTNWNVMLNSFSSLFGALLITLYYRRSKEFDKNQTMPKLFKFYWVAATLSVAVSTSVTTVYWPFSYTGSDKGLNDALTHAVNSAILVLDVFVNAHPPKFGHFIFPLCFGVTYGFIFSVPYTFLGGTDRWYNNYIYPSLDWKGETSTAFIFTFSTIILMSVMHLVVSLLAMLRIFIHKKIGLTKEIQKSESALNEV